MTQPLLTEIYTDDGHGLVAWPTTDLRRAVTLLGDLGDDALARAIAAIRAGRKGHEGPVAWHPLPNPTAAITGALGRAHAALTAAHVPATVGRGECALTLRDGSDLILSIGAPPDARPAPAFTPVSVQTPRGLTWAAVPHLARVAEEEADARLSRSARETAIKMLAHHVIHRNLPQPYAAEDTGSLGDLVESLPGCPQSGPWMSVAQVGGRPVVAYRRPSAMGGPAYGMVGLDDLTVGAVAEAAGVSTDRARTALQQAEEEQP